MIFIIQGFLHYRLHIHCYIYDVSADVFSGLQVFVKLEN